MKKLTYLVICLSLLFQICAGQTTPQKEFYNKDFNWRITIPENFEAMDTAEIASMQSKGAAAMNKANNVKAENHATTLFFMRSEQTNYFESDYQSFDPAVDGNFSATLNAINNMIYKTLTTQLTGAKVDTVKSMEKISNLEFYSFKTSVTYPNKMVQHMLTFHRLFGKKEFTVTIVYRDDAKGQQMLSAWRSSTFGR
jgi:hypothetical protein